MLDGVASPFVHQEGPTSHLHSSDADAHDIAAGISGPTVFHCMPDLPPSDVFDAPEPHVAALAAMNKFHNHHFGRASGANVSDTSPCLSSSSVDIAGRSLPPPLSSGAYQRSATATEAPFSGEETKRLELHLRLKRWPVAGQGQAANEASQAKEASSSGDDSGGRVRAASRKTASKSRPAQVPACDGKSLVWGLQRRMVRSRGRVTGFRRGTPCEI